MKFVKCEFGIKTFVLIEDRALETESVARVYCVNVVAIFNVWTLEIHLACTRTVWRRQSTVLRLRHVHQHLHSRSDSHAHINDGIGSRRVDGQPDAGRLRQLYVGGQVIVVEIRQIVEIKDGGHAAYPVRNVCRCSETVAMIGPAVLHLAHRRSAVEAVARQRVQLPVEIVAVDDERSLRVVVVVAAHRHRRQRKVGDVAEVRLEPDQQNRSRVG